MYLFLSVLGFSLGAVSRGYSLAWCRLVTAEASLWQCMASRLGASVVAGGFSGHSAWVQ